MRMPVQDKSAAPLVRHKRDPIMTKDDLTGDLVTYIAYNENVVYRLEARLVLRRPFVVVAADQMDMSFQLPDIICNRAFVSVGEIAEDIYMIFRPYNGVPVADQGLIVLLDRFEGSAIKAYAVCVPEMQVCDIKSSAHCSAFLVSATDDYDAAPLLSLSSAFSSSLPKHLLLQYICNILYPSVRAKANPLSSRCLSGGGREPETRMSVLCENHKNTGFRGFRPQDSSRSRKRRATVLSGRTAPDSAAYMEVTTMMLGTEDRRELLLSAMKDLEAVRAAAEMAESRDDHSLDRHIVRIVSRMLGPVIDDMETVAATLEDMGRRE